MMGTQKVSTRAPLPGYQEASWEMGCSASSVKHPSRRQSTAHAAYSDGNAAVPSWQTATPKCKMKPRYSKSQVRPTFLRNHASRGSACRDWCLVLALMDPFVASCAVTKRVAVYQLRGLLC